MVKLKIKPWYNSVSEEIEKFIHVYYDISEKISLMKIQFKMNRRKNKIWCNKMLTHFSTIDVLDCLLAEEKVNVITICQRSNKIGGWKIYKRDCEMRFSNWFWIINMMRTHNTHPREKNFHEMVISVWLEFWDKFLFQRKITYNLDVWNQIDRCVMALDHFPMLVCRSMDLILKNRLL